MPTWMVSGKSSTKRREQVTPCAQSLDYVGADGRYTKHGYKLDVFSLRPLRESLRPLRLNKIYRKGREGFARFAKGIFHAVYGIALR